MSEDPVTNRLLRQGLPVFTALASLLLALGLAAALSLGRDILVPITLAILLSFVLLPAVRALRRLRVPRGAAVLLVVALAFGALGGVGSLIGREAAQLATDLPRYSITLREKVAALREAAVARGAYSGIFDMVEELGAELQPPDEARGGDAPLGSARRPMQVEIHAGRSGLLTTLGNYAGGVLHPLATAGLVLLFTIFILLQREDLRNRAIRLAGSGDLRRTTAAIDDATGRLSRFFLAQLALNVAFGVVIGLGLWLIGLPSPILFGVIAGILRFVPYIGAAIGALLPLAVATAIDPGWSMVVATAALFVVVEPVAGHVVEPLLYGHSTGLSPVAVILSATIWTFLWGPIGLLLATPLTVCLVVLGRHVERLWFLDVILGDRPALDPQTIFYQRMLAGDPAEAIEQGTQFLRERALVTYYDEVVLAGLRMAEEEMARGSLDRLRQSQVGETFRAVVERLGQARMRAAKAAAKGTVGTEAAAALAAIGPDRGVARIVLGPEDLGPRWRGPAPVLCVAGRGVFEETATHMLAQILARHGLVARVVSIERLQAGERPDGLEGTAMVCLSCLDPVSLSQIRFLVGRARRALPGVKVLVGFWRERDPASVDRLRRTISADALVTSLSGALDAAVGFAQGARHGRPAAPRTDAAHAERALDVAAVQRHLTPHAAEPARAEPARADP